MAKKITPFNLYSCTVRLAGNLLNEVRKSNVTAPEIMVLAAIHGSDAVVNVEPAGARESESAERTAEINTDRYERGRLAAVYETAGPNKQGFIGRVFGPASIPLPRVMDEDRMPEGAIDLQVIPGDLRDFVEPNAALMG